MTELISKMSKAIKPIIYKLYCENNKDFCYIGSVYGTTLNQRLNVHKYQAKNKPNSKAYKFFNENGVDNMRIEIIKEYPEIKTIQQLHEKERDHINQIPEDKLLNTNTMRLLVDYSKDPEKLTIYNRMYYHHKNKYQMAKPEFCDTCKKYIRKSNMKKHIISDKHIKNL